VWGRDRVRSDARPEPKRPDRGRYRATLDTHGLLRLHNGEPRYLEVDSPRCLAEQPGAVYRLPLTATPRETDEDRNPFTADDLLPYRTVEEPACQREAIERRKVMRKARSKKMRPILLADLERRYRESPTI